MSKKRTSELVRRILRASNETNSYPKHKYAKEKLIPDKTYPGMYRIRWRDGTFSDIVNHARAQGAVNEFNQQASQKGY